MSVSKKLREALMLVRVLKSRKLTLADFPNEKAFHERRHLVQCRRCKGTGTEQGSAANCPQCGGRGVEKLSRKAIMRADKKQREAKDGH